MYVRIDVKFSRRRGSAFVSVATFTGRCRGSYRGREGMMPWIDAIVAHARAAGV